MNRNDFGSWGIELSPEDFRRALAVYGLWYSEYELLDRIIKVVETDQILQWVDPLQSRRPLQPNLYSARQLADIWTSVIDKYGEPIDEKYHNDRPQIRIEISGADAVRNLWYVEQLSKPEVRATSVYAGIYKASEIVWDWPLRVGLMSDPESRKLRGEIESLAGNSPWIKNLIKFIDFQTGETECDLLLLPQDLRSAMSAVLQAPRALNTDCVVVLGRLEDDRSVALLEALRTQARASGIAIAYVPNRSTPYGTLRAIWFKELLRQISHNQPIDVALFRASRDRDVKIDTPLLFATRELVESTLVSRRLDQFAKQISLEPQFRLPKSPPPFQGGREPDPPQQEESPDWHKMFQKTIWDHEGDTASALIRGRNEVEATQSETVAPPRSPRWIQAEVWEQSQNERRAVKQFLRPETTYSVVVFIGTSSDNSISADRPFNEEALPPGKNDHELVVSFSEPQISPEPQVATIVLPKEGNSSSCEFFLNLPAEISAINARITILHRNRILQTALLQAQVLNTENTETSKKIELIVESMIRPGMQDLSSRTWFDGALIMNHASDGTAQITKAVGEKVTRVQIGDLSETIKWFDDKITEVAEKWATLEHLESKKSRLLLLGCAMNGSALYDGLITAQRADDALVKADRVQVLSTRYGARFPIEFIYDRMAPLPDAPLCPNAKQSLLDGKCDGSCPTGTDEEKVICPLGFWGLNRIIERHAYDPEDMKDLAGADFGLQSEPVIGRNRLNVLANAIVAASAKVDAVEAGSTQKVIDALDEATGKQSKLVNSWADWATDINSRSPSLLVLLPHTLKDAVSGQQTLEISKKERLVYAHLQRKHVLGESGVPQPVVILMGCKTAAPDIPFESFVLKFRLRGAALVIGTGSSILGRHAAVVTRNFIQDIAAIKSSNITFGELMLKVRRKLVADGLLMGLCLTSYGDTDWLLS